MSEMSSCTCLVTTLVTRMSLTKVCCLDVFSQILFTRVLLLALCTLELLVSQTQVFIKVLLLCPLSATRSTGIHLACEDSDVKWTVVSAVCITSD